MKIKKRYIVIGFVSLLILATAVFIVNKQHTKNILFNKSFVSDKQINKKYPLKTEQIVDIKNIEEKKNPSVTLPSYVENIKISLTVLDKTYSIETKKESSVFDAMKKIEEKSTYDNMFNFKYRETSGLGNFITEINGEKGSPGKYWIYYVNNIKASVGVSQYILKEGDIISWKQEGI